MASDGKNLTGLWFEGQKYFADGMGEMTEGELPVFDQAEDWLRRYFMGQRPDPRELPLAPRGSEFRQRVWKCLLEIPCGQVTTYGAIAKALGCKSAQAVGGAVGHNPICVIIPCHRVVGANGSLTGYAGGIDRKKWLLEQEQGMPFSDLQRNPSSFPALLFRPHP